ncbi:10243_t:CDS:1, partial [Scutellospora calospora]
QVSEYKKLVQNLQTAKSLIDSLTKNINDKKLTETKNYLISFHQELQKDSKNRIWQGACQVLIKIKSKQKEFQQTCESLENSAEQRELTKQLSIADKLT